MLWARMGSRHGNGQSRTPVAERIFGGGNWILRRNSHVFSPKQLDRPGSVPRIVVVGVGKTLRFLATNWGNNPAQFLRSSVLSMIVLSRVDALWQWDLTAFVITAANRAAVREAGKNVTKTMTVSICKMSMLKKLRYFGTVCLELATALLILTWACLPLDNSLKEIS
jgi:hypothetical protein